jgi:hypothetical protein
MQLGVTTCMCVCVCVYVCLTWRQIFVPLTAPLQLQLPHNIMALILIHHLSRKPLTVTRSNFSIHRIGRIQRKPLHVHIQTQIIIITTTIAHIDINTVIDVVMPLHDCTAACRNQLAADDVAHVALLPGSSTTFVCDVFGQFYDAVFDTDSVLIHIILTMIIIMIVIIISIIGVRVQRNWRVHCAMFAK